LNIATPWPFNVQIPLFGTIFISYSDRFFQYYDHVEEAEWHVEAVKDFMPGVPVCASLCINEDTDVHGVPTGECGVKLARAGADVIGINCHYDPFRCLEAVKKMIKYVKAAGFDKVCKFEF